VDVVFHLASLLKVPWKPAFHTVNVQGAAHVAAACAAQQTPPTLVLVSSMAAAGPARGSPRAEDEPATPLSIYGGGKRDAELAARAQASRVPLTIVRPPMVYGEGDRGALPLFRSAARGLHLVPTWVPARMCAVHARDLSIALLSAAERGERVGAGAVGQGVYHVADPAPFGYDELGRRVATALDVEGLRVLRMPSAVTWLLAAASEMGGRIRDRPTVLNRDKFREATAGDWICDPSKAIAQLGFAPAPMADRLRQTASWYRVEGWL
jgi:dihydroflavonol-4-reductase